ncbi:MAG: methyltransferase domain-containing protein [Sulfuricurvum sp.]|nr:methyltransferase domain-containing protein [Sulfuricurvum sp.]
MIREDVITSLLKRIQNETGIVLSRQTDRDRISRYLDNGGEIPALNEKLPVSLINLVTTNETYFEREPHHFDRLIEEILPNLDCLDPLKPIRILSAPCSSGEESYSIALRLSAASVKLSRPIEIIGIDISEEMIEKARKGLYSPRSVHALDQSILERYFVCVDGYYQILPFSSLTVRFISGNVFDPELWKSLGSFDVIFSRNMMIYFDSFKNRELLKRFKEHLRGYLILGHADDHTQAKELFSPLRIERGVIYHS